MNRIKGNTGALLLFIGTIVITASFVLSLILSILGLGGVGELAAKAIIDAGGTQSDADLARQFAFITAIVVLVISSVVALLVIIPGFKYSLQGKAKTWAFVMAILEIISVVTNIIYNITSITGLISTLVGAIGAILYIIGAFMLRKQEA